MSKFAIEGQVKNVDHESGMVVAAFSIMSGSFGHGVNTKGSRVLPLLGEEKLAFALKRRGAAW